MEDLKTLMPHSKGESKMRRNKESLFIVNEIAEMKNCNKCLLFEGRKKRDLYLWAANIARGPSAKFRIINVHTMAELKMTGNCLKGSRPLLSFDQSFSAEENTHFALLKELFVQVNFKKLFLYFLSKSLSRQTHIDKTWEDCRLKNLKNVIFEKWISRCPSDLICKVIFNQLP